MGAARSPSRGLAATTSAFIIWGVFPLYLYGLREVPALQVIAHRVTWSCLLLLAGLAVRGELGRLTAVLARPALAGRLTLSAGLISGNWLVYVWSVTHNHVVDSSLGYFINPLVNVVLGVFVLHERLNRAQWLAVTLAAVAVGYLTVLAGRPPWIALALATSFSLYGLLRKVISVDALPGLAAETLLLMPLAAGYLAWCQLSGSGAFTRDSASVAALLVGSGPVTAIPLFLFAFGARRLPYSTVGLLQYIAPSLQLLSGVLFFHEHFGAARAVGFVLIWAALLIYVVDGLARARRARASPVRPSLQAGGGVRS